MRFRPLIATAHGRDIGVVPWLARRVGPFTSANRTPFPYVGPLVKHTHLAATLDAMRGFGRRHRAAMVQASFGPEAGLPQVFSAAPFTTKVGYTYVIDELQDIDAVWARLEGRCRTKVRKAKANGVELHEVSSGSSVLGAVVREVFAERGIPVGYRHYFPPTRADLDTVGMAMRWASARVSGVEVGSLVTLMDGARAVMWQGGVLPQHRSTQANTLLYWDAIEWASRSGAAAIDLVGSPDDGIDVFKKQFGGRRVPYLTLTAEALASRVLGDARRRIRRQSV
ncbi:GNAT family N-acetyltransferase [Amnibacterium sp.]|uniref:GNAT family N-acetyltransferase n=1 Tax=Amnibacterium sp. TaxID=1872496 RepID=UPI0026372695|nr:GNAT family N-acetyltransferase [Amnibacterium sp.]